MHFRPVLLLVAVQVRGILLLPLWQEKKINADSQPMLLFLFSKKDVELFGAVGLRADPQLVLERAKHAGQTGLGELVRSPTF